MKEAGWVRGLEPPTSRATGGYILKAESPRKFFQVAVYDN
jgi:hypothetical protein